MAKLVLLSSSSSPLYFHRTLVLFSLLSVSLLFSHCVSCINASAAAPEEISHDDIAKPQLLINEESTQNSDKDNDIQPQAKAIISFSNQSLLNSNLMAKHDRIKRNSIIGTNNNHVLFNNNNNGLSNNNGNSFSPAPGIGLAPALPTTTQQNVEGLLASCQLTNLLLYQLINQQQPQSPLASSFLGSAVAAPGGAALLSPLSPLNQLLKPAPLLTTYTTLSTYTTKMTSIDVVTIPLLFGNKPSPTTITRTKTFDVTTSTELTVTSTVTPSTSTTTVIVPVSSSGIDPTKASDAASRVEPSQDHFETPILNSLNTIESSTPNSNGRVGNKKGNKRKNRPQQPRSFQDEDEYGQDELSPVSNKLRRHNQQQPDYYNADYYPEIHQQQRLKRRGEVIDPEEYILEPSFDSSSNIQLAEECPSTTTTVTVTVTKTKTMTKLVNPSAPTAAAGDLAFVRETDSYDSSNNNAGSSKKNFVSSRPKNEFSNRRDKSRNSRSSSTNKGYNSDNNHSPSPSSNDASSTSTGSEQNAGRRRGGSTRRRNSGSTSAGIGSNYNTTPQPETTTATSTRNNNNGKLSNSEINNRRSKSRFHANYYGDRYSA